MSVAILQKGKYMDREAITGRIYQLCPTKASLPRQRKSRLHHFVVVADSGLMNKSNVRLLQQAGYKYIIGARIKNETTTIIINNVKRI